MHKPDQTTSGGTDKMTDRQMYQSLIQMLWSIKEENSFLQPQQCKDIVKKLSEPPSMRALEEE